jgi:hypothetical protein
LPKFQFLQHNTDFRFIVLEGVPVKPRNAWQIYLRENMKNHKNAEGKIDIRVVTKELSAVWKTLGDAEKQVKNETRDKSSLN